MEQQAQVSEASRNFSNITHQVDAGDEVILTRNGKPSRVEEIAKRPGKTYSLSKARKKLGL